MNWQYQKDRWAWRKYYLGQTMNSSSTQKPNDEESEAYKRIICAMIKQCFLDLVREKKCIYAEIANAKRNVFDYRVTGSQAKRIWEASKKIISYRKKLADAYESEIRNLCERIDLNARMIINRADAYAKGDYYEQYKKLVRTDLLDAEAFMRECKLDAWEVI